MDSGSDVDPLEMLPQTAQMRLDLKDPGRRDALRTEHRAGLSGYYPDICEELQLTARQQETLFDLFADFQMRHLDIFYAQDPGDQPARMARFQQNEAQREAALLSLLGPETLEKFHRYQLEIPERHLVAELSRKLDPTQTLSPAQRSRLMAVAKTERERTQSERQTRRLRRLGAVGRAHTPAELREVNIRANEDGLHDLEAQSQRLLQQAATFLTAFQLATLTQLETRKVDAQRRWVHNLRSDPQSTDLVVTSKGVAVTAHSTPDRD